MHVIRILEYGIINKMSVILIFSYMSYVYVFVKKKVNGQQMSLCIIHFFHYYIIGLHIQSIQNFYFMIVIIMVVIIIIIGIHLYMELVIILLYLLQYYFFLSYDNQIRSQEDSYLAASGYTKGCSSNSKVETSCFGKTHFEERFGWFMIIQVGAIGCIVWICVRFL